MKKYLLMALAVFSFTFANAQGFKFGVKGGGNYSTYAGGDKDVYGDPEFKWGYHLGLTSLYELDSDGFLGIKPELLYTTKGFQQSYSLNMPPSGTKRDYEVKRSLNYISLPILLNINAGGLFFELGPEVSYMVTSTSEVKYQDYLANGDKNGESVKDEAMSAKEDLSSIDFGYVAGLGYMSDMGLGIGIRYNGGLVGIIDTKNAEEKDIKNSVFMVSLSYMFGGGSSSGSSYSGTETKSKVKYKSE